MSLLTTDRYRAITGDDAADATVSALIEEALGKLEEDLGRPLEAVQRIEQVWPDRRGYLYPLATPITEAEGWTVEGNALRAGSWPLSASWPATVDYVVVAYTGGYLERTANPDATNRLPVCIERDLAWATYALGHPSQLAAQLPAGASAVSVGDISVSFGGGGTMRSGDDLAIRWSRSTLRYRRRGL